MKAGIEIGEDEENSIHNCDSLSPEKVPHSLEEVFGSCKYAYSGIKKSL